MAKTIVDQNGRMRTIVDSREVQLQKQFDSMEDALRKEDRIFTRRWLTATYGLRAHEFIAFLKLMELRECLAVECPIAHRTGSRVTYSEKCWKIVSRPTPKHQWVSTFPGKTPSKREQRKMYCTHLCDRCGSNIPGRGRHNKASRGHTRDKCDVSMVKVIHDS